MVNAKLNKALRLIALFVLLGVIVYIYLLSTSEDVGGLREKLSRLTWSDMIAPVALSLMSYLLRFFRWRLILTQLGQNLSLKSDLICYLSGFALTMTPGKSGETIRSAFLLQARVPVHASLTAFVLERSFDLLVVGLLASLLFLQPPVAISILLVILIAISLLARHLVHLEQAFSGLSLPPILRQLVHILIRASVALKPKPIAIYALLGAGAWLAQGVGFYFIVSLFETDFVGQGFGVLSAIGTYCTGLIIGAASLIPGGIGVTEGSLSWLLQTQGLDQNSAILSALISRLCTLWLAVAIGCGALLAIIKGHPTG